MNLQKQIEKHLKKHGTITKIDGAFYNRFAYIEKTELGNNLGVTCLETTFYDCKFKWRVNPDQELLKTVTTVKAIYMGILRLIRYNPLILLRPYKILDFLDRIYTVHLQKLVSYKQSHARSSIKLNYLPPVCKELMRVGKEISELYPVKDWQKDALGLTPGGNEKRTKVLHLFEALSAFIWSDGAYYFRAVDFFSIIHQGFFRALKICLGREHEQVKSKLIILIFVFRLMYLIPRFRKIIKILETIKLDVDEDDRFFGYQRNYDFEGLSFAERSSIIKNNSL